MELDLATKIFTDENWKIGFTRDCFIVSAPSHDEAHEIATVESEKLAKWAQNFSREATVVRYPGGKPYRIPAEMAMQTDGAHIGMAKNMFSDRNLNLVGADYRRILELLMQQKEEGNIVIITSNVTRDENGNPINTENPTSGRDICHHTNDLLLPSRASWTASQFTGYNYRRSWRRGFDDFERLNPEYHRLREALAKDGCAPNFEYTLYRPDGALCSYSTSYFLCNDYCGDQVRIGISRPQDWSLIESAPELAIV